jgi:hypothetical protein
MTYDFIQCRAICAELETELGVYNWREVIEELKDEQNDFEVAGYRFIHKDIIDKIQQEELASDEYVLGCFNAWFLTDYVDLDEDTIKTIQQANPEAIGKMVISKGTLPDLQAEYVSCDGYGHHFAHYDGNEYDLNNCDFFAFRVN